MKTAGTVEAIAKKFDRLSLRERVLTSAATLVVLVAVFHVLLLHRLDLRRKLLTQQLTEIAAIGTDTTAADGTDSPGATLERTVALAAQLKQANALLDSQAAGLIPPRRMTQVIHDVLSRQQGVTLVSLRTIAPHALVGGSGTSASEGPYVHSVELVMQGQYLDVLAYLQALESLPYHFYWQSLDLDATHYPMTQVTVRLGTVSMSHDWIQL